MRDASGYERAAKAAAELEAAARATGGGRAYLTAFDTSGAAKRLLTNRLELREREEELRKLEADKASELNLVASVSNLGKFVKGLEVGLGVGQFFDADTADQRVAAAGRVVPAVADIGKIEGRRLEVSERIRRTADLKAGRLADQMRKLEDEFSTLIGDRWAALRVCFAEPVGLSPKSFRPFRDILAGVDSAARRETAVAQLDARWRHAAGLGHCDVLGMALWVEYVTADTLALDAKGAVRAKQSDELFAHVEPLLKAAALLPDDRAYDLLRGEALLAVAKVVRDAVAHERFPKSWSEAFDVRSDYGLRIADAALTASGPKGALAGRVQGVRAALLLQRGLKEVALDGVERAKPLLIGDYGGRYTLARIHGANLNAGACQEHFLAAARLGRVPLDRLLGDNDFSPIHVSGVPPKNHLWQEYEHPALKVRYTTTPATVGKPHWSFEIENTGSLPVVNATVFVDTRRNPAKDRLGKYDIAYLAAGQKEVWADAFQGTNEGAVPDVKPNHKLYMAFRNGRQTFKNGPEKEGVFNPRAEGHRVPILSVDEQHIPMRPCVPSGGG